MKKRKGMAAGLLRAALSLLLAFGAQTFIGPCLHEDGGRSVCLYAGKMATALGILLFVWAVICLFLKKEAVKSTLAFASLGVSLLTMMLPGGVLPLCGMETMRCHLIMKPSVRILAGLLALLALGECAAYYCRERGSAKREKKEKSL